MEEDNLDHVEIFDRSKFVLTECRKWVSEHSDELICKDITKKTPLQLFDKYFSPWMVEKYDFVKDFRDMLCD